MPVQNPPNVLGNGDRADRKNDGQNDISKDSSKDCHTENASTAGRLGR
jgi:hypothetical protein